MKSQLSIAVELADSAHKYQMYGEFPYMVHLFQVDRMVIHAYTDKNRSNSDSYSKEPCDEVDCLRAIAYLHDIIEDQGFTRGKLYRAGLISEVVGAVYAMSKREGESYNTYIDRVISNNLARKVKLCDTSANLMNSIKDGNVKRINKYSKQLQLLGGF